MCDLSPDLDKKWKYPSTYIRTDQQGHTTHHQDMLKFMILMNHTLTDYDENEIAGTYIRELHIMNARNPAGRELHVQGATILLLQVI